MATRSGTYTITEVQPAGAASKNWAIAKCNGDYIIAGVNNGRLYMSSNRGASWDEEQPAGAADIYWFSGDVGDAGQAIAGVGGRYRGTGRLYIKLSGSWAEAQPAGDVDARWNSAAMSPNGSRMLAAAYAGRLYSYYDGSWTEERPAGDANKNWWGCAINNNGDMIASIAGGRVYVKPAGGSWAETQPAGATNQTWHGVAISADGTKYSAAAFGNYAYHFDGSSWARIIQSPTVTNSNVTYNFDGCCCDSTGEKILLPRDAGCYYNFTANEVNSGYNWPGFPNTTYFPVAGISQDASIVVVAGYGQRIWVAAKDPLPDQSVGGYYKEFTITHAAGTRYNHKVRLRIFNKYVNDTYLHCEGRANDDFSDIYFKNAAGNVLRHSFPRDESGCNSYLYGYYRYVWVELDEIGTSPSTFRMYYGDSAQSDSSTAPASFFDVYDDFERGSSGDAIGGGWTVVQGTVRINTTCYWHGTRSAEFVGGGTPGIANISAAADDETYIGLWAAKSGDGSIGAQHGDGNTYAQWQWAGNGYLQNYTGGAYETSLVSPFWSDWQLFEMHGFNWTADTYDLYRNATAYSDLAMQASAGYTDILQLFTVSTANYKNSYAGLLIVCSNCTPGVSPDSESIGAEVLAGVVESSGPAGVKTWNDIPSANIKTWNDVPWNTIKTMN